MIMTVLQYQQVFRCWLTSIVHHLFLLSFVEGACCWVRGLYGRTGLQASCCRFLLHRKDEWAVWCVDPMDGLDVRLMLAN
jgi:hypothetical protein